MLNKTITNALLALRAEIVRENLEGLKHVNALLALRGVDPACCPVRRKQKADAARKGAMRRIVLGALRGGPKRVGDLAAIVAAVRPELQRDAAYRRTSQVLDKRKRWGGRPPAASMCHGGGC